MYGRTYKSYTAYATAACSEGDIVFCGICGMNTPVLVSTHYAIVSRFASCECGCYRKIIRGKKTTRKQNRPPRTGGSLRFGET